ncbi:outer dense fiber protein 3 [Lutzomyia longipalpis]|uniref:outer dense fiber protein 3 n=1 Tax=Lutzomyia longipalpis TaxID=7200 RepID=UPI0024839D54|nr:outer dense fiber protein 3 [Lutzomyia longipalpis]
MCNVNKAPYNLLPTTVGFEGHDLRFNRNPMFSLGASRYVPKGDTVNAKMSLGMESSNITRFGKQEAPKFSIVGRRDAGHEGAHSPGPIYSINDNLTRQNPPKYSLKGRTKEIGGYTAPGPKYAINDFGKPSAPAFSLGKRTFQDHKEKGPGPTKYGSPNMNACFPKSSQFSMRFRQKEIGDNFSGPAPNCYYPKFTSSCKCKGFSFGVKHHACAGNFTSPEDDY